MFRCLGGNALEPLSVAIGSDHEKPCAHSVFVITPNVRVQITPAPCLRKVRSVMQTVY